MDEDTVWQRAVSVMAEEMEKGRLVIFVGAGCSCAAGLPSWSELLQLLIAKFGIKTKVTDPLRAAGRLDREIGKLKVHETVAESLLTNPDLRIDLYRALVALPANLFVTTNYDHLLENAFRQAGIEPTVIVRDNDIPFIDPTRKTIVNCMETSIPLLQWCFPHLIIGATGKNIRPLLSGWLHSACRTACFSWGQASRILV